MQYAVPQFIEVEDKVVGPLTARQFLYLVVGGVVLLITWALADISLFILLAIIISVIVIPFAFIKMNGRPFEFFVKGVFKFYTTPKLRLWIKDTKTPHLHISDMNKRADRISLGQTEKAGSKKFNRSKIKELTQILDMGGMAATTEVKEVEKLEER